MAPTSRGVLLLRLSRPVPLSRIRFSRPIHASTKLSMKIKIPDLRPKQQPKLSSSTGKSADPRPSSPKRPHWSRLGFMRLRGNQAFKMALLVLPWIPIVAVAIHHSPFGHYTVEGPSMKPTFNPNHNREAGTLNTTTSVLVLKQNYSTTSLWAFVSDLFARNNYRRKDHLPQRGQIVAYRTPYNPERVATKRVVGLPGDRVTPLDGYPGGPEPVIVPWNHLWLEGDIEDRHLSLDSNYFGPVSANLVIGTVGLVLWSFTPVNWKDATYPAQSRVEHNVVPQQNPDDVNRLAFLDGRAAEDLRVVKAYPLHRPLTPPERQQWTTMHRVAADEAARKDTQTYELASALEAELRLKLSAKAVTETLSPGWVTKEEFERFQNDGVVPESVWARSKLRDAAK